MTSATNAIANKKVGRRSVLRGAAAGLLTFATPSLLRAQDSDLHVGAFFDLTGNLNLYGIQNMNAARYAIAEINKKGGVLGRKVQLHEFDTQSKVELYSRYAREVASDDRITAVVGGTTGASREAARPILTRAGKLLFFPMIDEGGECDKYCFMQGTDCVQQQGPLIEWAIKERGPKVYIVAADYIYGHVAAAWGKDSISKLNGEVSGTEFIPLDVSDFSSTLRRIQDAGPNVILSNLVGSNHVAFYRQFAAAGLTKRMQIVSPVFGLGNEQLILSPDEAMGIVVAYSYFEQLDGASNTAFLSGYRAMFPNGGGISDSPAQVWNGWHQWAQAVASAGSTDVDAVVAALEAGTLFEGPAGPVKMDGPSHRNIQNVHLAEVQADKSYRIIQKFDAVAPTRDVIGAGTCDLTGKDASSHVMIQPKF